MAEEKTTYYTEFFALIDQILKGEKKYKDLSDKYSANELADIIGNALTIGFSSLIQMDTAMDYLLNMLYVVNFTRSREKKFPIADEFAEDYDDFTERIIREIRNQIKIISESKFLSAEVITDFKRMLQDTDELLIKRNEKIEDSTTK